MRINELYSLHPERHWNFKHGAARAGQKTDEYGVWCLMISRCYNPNATSYPRYGAKGVTVCDRWRNSFEHFLEDMGKRSGPKFSIDRLDNDKGYMPANCKWATQIEQHRNQKRNKKFEFRGKQRCIAEIAELVGLKYRTLQRRLTEANEPIEIAVREVKHATRRSISRA